MSDEAPLDEKMRTCPSCRTPISVLASKCKFCGEVVGKPKEETRQLSINDLGGETVHHRALSSSVMDALESFRIEDEQDATAGKGFSGLDSLDVPSASLDDPYSDQLSSAYSAPAITPSTGNRVALVAKIAVVLVVVAIAAIKIPSFIKSSLETPSDAKIDVYYNRAPDILEANGDSIEALIAAVEATREAPSPENTKIADEVMAKVTLDIEELLNARAWTPDSLKQASLLASRAVELYPTKKSTAIRKVVDTENIDYSMALTRIDPAAKEVVFQLNTAGSPQAKAKVGDLIADRFELVSISDSSSVKLKDTKRNGRALVCRVGRGPS